MCFGYVTIPLLPGDHLQNSLQLSSLSPDHFETIQYICYLRFIWKQFSIITHVILGPFGHSPLIPVICCTTCHQVIFCHGIWKYVVPWAIRLHSVTQYEDMLCHEPSGYILSRSTKLCCAMSHLVILCHAVWSYVVPWAIRLYSVTQ